jgi:protoporphyrinogen oxidase
VIQVRYCILGGGPAGLAFAHRLKQSGITSFVLLEQEAAGGGLCRSETVDGAPLDIRGGHFLDGRRQAVLDFLFQFMPRSEWVEHKRVAKIRFRGQEVDHPLESHLWQLPEADQQEFLASIAAAGCVAGRPQPESFEHWVRWKLGDRIADEYMLPYNRKMWCLPLDRLGTYWLHKLPDVSYQETLESCRRHAPAGTLPAHGTFLYPRAHGYGEVWRRMAVALGDQFVPGGAVTRVDPCAKTVNGRYRYERLVTTIPWTLWRPWGVLPAEIDAAAAELVHTSVDVDYYPDNLPTTSHWTYEPDEAVSHHRLLLRHNFCGGARGYWTEANAMRSGAVRHFRHRNEHAYPVNTRGKPAAMTAIARWAAAHGITPLGRWGTWEHMNSDVVVEQALAAAGAAAHE